MKKISLTAQLAEIDRELAERERVYDRMVKTGKLRQSRADFQMVRMQGVRATLVWFLKNEPFIKQRMSY